MSGAASPARGSGATPARVGPTGVLLRGLPRLLLNSLAPIGGFYVGHRVSGLIAGIVTASVASLVLFAWERRNGRPGVLARLSLVVVIMQAVVGLSSRIAFLYFLPSIAVDLNEGTAFCASALSRRPLAWHLAREIIPLPQHLIDQPDMRSMFGRVTLVWGGYFALRGLACLAVLSLSDTSTYLLTRVLLDLPVVIPLLGGSLSYVLRRLDQTPSADVMPAAGADKRS